MTSSSAGEPLLLRNSMIGAAAAPASVDSSIMSATLWPLASFIRCSSEVAVAAVLSFLTVTRDLVLVFDESETRFKMVPVVRASAVMFMACAVVRASASISIADASMLAALI